MPDVTDALSKHDLLASIRHERARLDGLIAGVSPERLAEATLDGGWSIKDLLAHISGWEKICMALVRNNEPINAPPPGESGPSTDVINARMYEGNRDKPAEDIFADAQRSYAALVDMIEGLSEQVLGSRLGGDQAAEASPTVAALISGNSDEHYREHSEQIEAWLAANPA
jgi:hypothetical protein